MKNRLLLMTFAVLALGSLGLTSVWAQDVPPNQPPADPGQGVARVSVVHGTVSTMRGDSGEWVATTVNTPLMPGDKIGTGANSRAEIQLDFANILRLNQSTEAMLTDLKQNRIQVQLASGLAEASVFKGTQADIEIDTPNMGVHPLSNGLFRIQVNSPSETQLIVRQGEAEVLTNQGSTKVEAGQIIYIHGTDNPEYRVDQAPAGDDFDKWAFDRDKQIASAQAWQHTDQYYTGSGDLDAYGQWSEVPGYDWCWTPYVDAGWVPYQDGRWLWEPYYGWTWVGVEPWGWAPYHYGRWLYYGNRWSWWPGVGFYGPRPIWAPAYVSFFGFGGAGFGMGFGFGFGSIGWLPLGPRDIFHPWYGGGRSFSVVNINNFYSHGVPFTTVGGRPYGSNLERLMTDAHLRGALTTVSTQNFADGRIAHNFQPVSESMLRSASMVHGTLPVVPTRASLGEHANGFASAGGQHFFSRGPVASSHPGNFAAESSQIRSMVQRGPTANAGGEARFGATAPRTEGQMTARGGATPSTAGGWQRFSGAGQTGRSPESTGSARSNPAPQGNQGGWGRFSNQPAPGGERMGSGQTPAQSPRTNAAPEGRSAGWQRFSQQPRASTGGGGYSRPFESGSGGASRWNAPAPRSGGSYYGGGRPPLQLNRPIMRQRSSGGGNYGSGGRTYSAPRSSGGSGGHTYSAPHVSGGGGGGGGHSGGGSHGGGKR